MWPFKRKQLDIATLPKLSDDSHSWGVAQADVNSSPLIIRYNESARNWVGHPELPIKLGFAIPLNRPNEGGLPDPAENEQLNEIEDTVVREIEARTRALHAIALTTGVMKEFVFYIPRGTDIKTLHEAIQAAVTTHEVQCMAINEPKWDSYRQFSP
ncbi:MAG: DUF695 domain-containing protein [Planctomycetota bacterium]